MDKIFIFDSQLIHIYYDLDIKNNLDIFNGSNTTYNIIYDISIITLYQ
jgi:hypothetical protein